MRIQFWSLLLITLFMVSCLGSRDFVVESDYSYSGNFKKYKTYDFLTLQKFNLDTLVPENILKDAIDYRMSLLGYKKDTENPNILVSYKMFFSDFQFKGYDQPELEEWLADQDPEDEQFDPIKYQLKEGTLIILFMDSKKNKAIWQGYNSGLMDPASISNERFVKGTVRTIFDKYKIFAQGYLKES